MLSVVQVASAGQLAQFHELVDELRAWDIQMSRSIGLDVDTMLDLFYAGSPVDLAVDDHRMERAFVATYDGVLAGCGALKKLSDRVAELTRVYVRPAYRGKGLARAVVVAIIESARDMGYATLSLESAVFMKDAHALYRSLGFELTPPFRALPDELKEAEVFMKLELRA
jgi:GNAT superfamily N-acetyltransferase